MELTSRPSYIRRMIGSYRPSDPDPLAPTSGDTSVERAEKLRREAAVIARAHADIEAGCGVEHEVLEAWLDQLELDENTPPPIAASRISRRCIVAVFSVGQP
jgi:hypothetical protein